MDNQLINNVGYGHNVPFVFGSVTYPGFSQFHRPLEPYIWSNNPLASSTAINAHYSNMINSRYNIIFNGSNVDIVSHEEVLVTIVPVRELSYEDAREEILNHIRGLNGQPIYLSEIAETLHIDIDLIIFVVENLEREGLVDDED